MSACIIDNCDRPVHVKKRGLCQPHYMWHWQHGSLEGYTDSPAMRPCADCGTDFAPAMSTSKYCSETCRNAASWKRVKASARYHTMLADRREAYVPTPRKTVQRIERGCDIEGCNGKHRARGLCGTHYNQTNPNRHKKVDIACSACGVVTKRDAASLKYETNYCSLPCQMHGRWGKGQTSTIPADHWARMYGATCEWHPPVLAQTIACEWCGTNKTSKAPGIRFCSRKCKAKAKAVRRRGLEHDAPGQYTWMDITRLWETFDRCCAYCSTPTPLAYIQAEHVHPLSKGGRNGLSNLLPSCGACNSDKRDLLLTDWNQDRARRGLLPVTVTWSPTDSRYAHLIAHAFDLAA